MASSSAKLVLLVGTQRGLFRFESDLAREGWRIDGPLIRGYEISHAWLDGRTPRTGYAAANHIVWGSHVYRSEDLGRSWSSLPAVPCHPSGERGQELKRMWFLAPGHPGQPDVVYAGIDPAGLFVSLDRGASWEPVAGLNHHRSRAAWEPARGIFAVHSIYVDPTDPRCLYAAVSAGGAFRSEDGGESWVPINRGIRMENRPGRDEVVGHNIHRLAMHPARPSRLYRQCYSGTYRSDNRGQDWSEITDGLPSDFGHVVATHPGDPDVVFVVPEESSDMRATVGGKLRVYRSLDAGREWEALTRGLPQRHAYVTVLREAMAADGRDPTGVYFGTTGGHLFASGDGGESWDLLAGYLPRILSVTAAVVAVDESSDPLASSSRVERGTRF